MHRIIRLLSGKALRDLNALWTILFNSVFEKPSGQTINAITRRAGS